MTEINSSPIILRLTAIWAFTECALGGAMHALHIPFTGIVAGGFAVLIIGLLAYFSDNDMKVMIGSTILVMIVKLTVSPQAPPPAYLAVAFQGFTGALIFRLIPSFSISAFIFAILAMAESALQKLLLVWVFFGKSLFEAMDAFYVEVLKIFSLQPTITGSTWVIGGYLLLYLTWGLMLGIWIPRLPKQLTSRAGKYDHLLQPLSNSTLEIEDVRRKKNRIFLFTLLFITLVFLYTGKNAEGSKKLMYIFLRTISAVFIWVTVAVPVFSWLLEKFLKNSRSNNALQLKSIMNLLPEFSARAIPLYLEVGKNYKGWKRIREWMIGLIVIGINIPGNE
ncbi:hypothetical protein BH11BAC2_BH11BAC2_05840 [soil metagenome]